MLCKMRRSLITDEEFQRLDPDEPITFGHNILMWPGREDWQLWLGFPLRNGPRRLLTKQLRMISKESKFVA
jgi:hypothetical protein